jgi:hypothetical protein
MQPYRPVTGPDLAVDDPSDTVAFEHAWGKPVDAHDVFVRCADLR